MSKCQYPDETYKVYIVYTETDINFMTGPIIKIEKELGIKCYIQDRDMDVGVVLHEEQTRIIECCEYVLLWITKEYLKDEGCCFQQHYAHVLSPAQWKKKLIPIYMTCPHPNNRPQILRQVSGIDMSSPEKIDMGTNRLLRQLSEKDVDLKSDWVKSLKMEISVLNFGRESQMQRIPAQNEEIHVSFENPAIEEVSSGNNGQGSQMQRSLVQNEEIQISFENPAKEEVSNGSNGQGSHTVVFYERECQIDNLALAGVHLRGEGLNSSTNYQNDTLLEQKSTGSNLTNRKPQMTKENKILEINENYRHGKYTEANNGCTSMVIETNKREENGNVSLPTKYVESDEENEEDFERNSVERENKNLKETTEDNDVLGKRNCIGRENRISYIKTEEICQQGGQETKVMRSNSKNRDEEEHKEEGKKDLRVTENKADGAIIDLNLEAQLQTSVLSNQINVTPQYALEDRVYPGMNTPTSSCQLIHGDFNTSKSYDDNNEGVYEDVEIPVHVEKYLEEPKRKKKKSFKTKGESIVRTVVNFKMQAIKWWGKHF